MSAGNAAFGDLLWRADEEEVAGTLRARLTPGRRIHAAGFSDLCHPVGSSGQRRRLSVRRRPRDHNRARGLGCDGGGRRSEYGPTDASVPVRPQHHAVCVPLGRLAEDHVFGISFNDLGRNLKMWSVPSEERGGCLLDLRAPPRLFVEVVFASRREGKRGVGNHWHA